MSSLCGTLLVHLLVLQAINPILEYIKRGLVRDRDAFQVHLQAILDRVSQQPMAGPPLGATNGASVITTNAELEVWTSTAVDCTEQYKRLGLAEAGGCRFCVASVNCLMPHLLTAQGDPSHVQAVGVSRSACLLPWGLPSRCLILASMAGVLCRCG